MFAFIVVYMTILEMVTNEFIFSSCPFQTYKGMTNDFSSSNNVEYEY